MTSHKGGLPQLAGSLLQGLRLPGGFLLGGLLLHVLLLELRLGDQLLWFSCEDRWCGVDCLSGPFNDKAGPSIVTKRPGRAI